jgi:hypothetical protein
MSLAMLQCAAVAAVNIIIEHKKKRYPKRWMSISLERRNQNLNILEEVRLDSYALFRNFTRMTTSDFELLLQLIGPSIKKQDTNMREAIPISTRLAVTLRFLATGDSYRTLMYVFHISVPAISTIIPEVCQAIIKSLKGYVAVSKKRFIGIMSTLTNEHKCMYESVLYTIEYYYVHTNYSHLHVSFERNELRNLIFT